MACAIVTQNWKNEAVSDYHHNFCIACSNMDFTAPQYFQYGSHEGVVYTTEPLNGQEQ